MTIPQLLIFDFDGTLYPFSDELIAELFSATGHCGHILSDGAWDHEHASQMGYQSFLDTGLGNKTVCDEFKKSLHGGFHYHHQFINMDLKPDMELIAALEALDRDNVHLMILTQSDSTFLDRKLKLLGLDQFFPKSMRVTHDQHGFKPKNAHADGFVATKAIGQSATGIDFNDGDIWMFEDTPKNLIIPHEMGWNTVLVGQGDKEVTIEEHIHHVFDTPSYVVQSMPQRKSPTSALQL